MRELTIFLQALVAASIFFVWVVRYENIVKEFRTYGLPESLRDVVGILKLTFALCLLIGIERPLFAIIGGSGILILMGAAVVTHLRIKNPVFKMLPSLALLACSAFIVWSNYQLPR
ncbi:MAG: DoxX family protein [Verrucomicrobiota bacterium]